MVETREDAADRGSRAEAFQEGSDEDEWSVISVDDGEEDDSDWDSDDDDLLLGSDDEGDGGGDFWQLAAAGSLAGAAAAGRAAAQQQQKAAAEPLPRALASVPRHVLRELERQQQEAEEEAARLRPAERKKAAARQKTHQRLRIISGTAAGRRLVSPQGDQTRPMMEMVRGAIFNMLMSMYGCQGSQLPEHTRWLDLFAGTGAIGLEALSRGCGEAHFVELSPWVVSNCLLPNLESCELEDSAVVHTMKAEDFLQKALKLPSGRFAGGAFDFVSVCPPYMLVSYEELYDLLEKSPLLHEESLVVVEYPKKLGHLIRDTLGPLQKLRDRRYGRTYIAVYGPGDGSQEGEEEG
ncbi:hypothetical protein N2152v2_011049 [Parachlorella kessleri]